MAGTNVPGLENNTPQYTTQVPGVQFPFRQEFGKEGQAYERLGESVENLAGAGAQVYDEVQRQSDISTFQKATVDSGVAHAAQLEKLSLTSPDGFSRDPNTGEILKNEDGSQRTIAQDYWSWADQDFQARQQNMSPRAAAMYRAQMLPEIGHNTQWAQREALTLQQQSSDSVIGQNMQTLARSNDTNPYPTLNAYYPDKQADGSVLLRGNTDKINDQLRTLKLQTMQQGPVSDPTTGEVKAGMYDQTTTQKLAQERLAKHSEDWLTSALTNITENDTVRDRKNALSTTALQQAKDLRDVVEGKDPKSLDAQAKGLPTVNNSLSATQIDQWRARLDAFKPEAKAIDDGDYKVYLNEAKMGAHGATDFNKFMTSPLMQHLIYQAKIVNQDSPEKSVDDLSEPVSNALIASALSKSSGMSSPDTKKALVNQEIQRAQQYWPQLTRQLGFQGDTSGFAQAISARALKEIGPKLDEDARKQYEDLAAYGASSSLGGSLGSGGARARSPDLANIANYLNGQQGKSLLAIFNPVPGGSGQSVLEQSDKALSKYTSIRDRGPGTDVWGLSNDQFKAEASKIQGKDGFNKPDPEALEKYVESLNAIPESSMSPQRKEAFLHGLVTKGGLPQPYADALSLQTPQERISRFTTLLAGSASNTGVDPAIVRAAKQASLAENKDLFSVVDHRQGFNSPGALRDKAAYDQSWQRDYIAARQAGNDDGGAREVANNARDKTLGSFGKVPEQNKFFFFEDSQGASVSTPVVFGRHADNSNYSQAEKQNIIANLQHAQSPDELSKHQIIRAPGQAAPNLNESATDAQWVAKHAYLWDRIPGGYRLQVQTYDAGGHPTGHGVPVQVADSPSGFYDVKDSQAMLPRGK